MITICAYCKRQRINGAWFESLPIAPDVLISHGTCPECYAREMRAAGFTEEEIAEDLI
jgi:hypothetical protein